MVLSASSADRLTTPKTTSFAALETARPGPDVRTKYAHVPVRPSAVRGSVDSVKTFSLAGVSFVFPSSTSRSAGRAPPRGWYAKTSVLGPSASKKESTAGWRSRSFSIAATGGTSNAVASCARAEKAGEAGQPGGTRG
jgi:hypothetical protein